MTNPEPLDPVALSAAKEVYRNAYDLSKLWDGSPEWDEKSWKAFADAIRAYLNALGARQETGEAEFRDTPGGGLEVLDGGVWAHVPAAAARVIRGRTVSAVATPEEVRLRGRLAAMVAAIHSQDYVRAASEACDCILVGDVIAPKRARPLPATPGGVEG